MPRVPEKLLPFLLAGTLLPGCTEPPKPAPRTPVASITTKTPEPLDPTTAQLYPEIANKPVYQRESFRTTRSTVNYYNLDNRWIINHTRFQMTFLTFNQFAQPQQIPFGNDILDAIPTSKPYTHHFFSVKPEPDNRKPYWNLGNTDSATTESGNTFISQVTPGAFNRADNRPADEASANLQAYVVICQSIYDVIPRNDINNTEAENFFCNSFGLMALYRIGNVPYVEYDKHVSNTPYTLSNGQRLPIHKFTPAEYNRLPLIGGIFSHR